MQIDYHLLSKNNLFKNIAVTNIPKVLNCLGCFKKVYAKNEIIFSANDPICHAGIILKGLVDINQASIDGNYNLINQVLPGELFGGALACSSNNHHLLEITASAYTEILFIGIPKISSPGSCQCPYRLIVLENLLLIIANQNVYLNKKIQLVTEKSLRNKLCLYFSHLSKEQLSTTINLPFRREKLAHYLSADRSAISRELMRMEKDGLIQVTRNQNSLLYMLSPPN